MMMDTCDIYIYNIEFEEYFVEYGQSHKTLL